MNPETRLTNLSRREMLEAREKEANLSNLAI